MKMSQLAQNKKGFLLVECLIALAILTILFGTSYGIISFASHQLASTRLQVTQTRLTQTLFRLAASPAALRAASAAAPASEPYNIRYFDFCINGGDFSQPCYNENIDGKYAPFRLYLASVINTEPSGGMYGLKTSGAITGIPDYPMRYDSNGNICDTSIGSCPPADYPLEAFTEFLPICYNQWTSYWRGWGASKPAEPLYPAAFAPLSSCLFSRFMKVRLTVRASAYSGSGPRPQTVLNTTIDTFAVHFARQ